MNIMLAFPALLLAIFVVSFFNSPNSTREATARPIWPIVLALSILSIPPLTRLVRANTIVYAQRGSCSQPAASAPAAGGSCSGRSCPTWCRPWCRAHGTAILIVAEGALAYLGLSVEAPTPTWGKMIFAGKDRLQEAWWISMMPALVLFLTILSINLIGDVLAEKFNIRDSIG